MVATGLYNILKTGCTLVATNLKDYIFKQIYGL
jgi:hypothetical protein